MHRLNSSSEIFPLQSSSRVCAINVTSSSDNSSFFAMRDNSKCFSVSTLIDLLYSESQQRKSISKFNPRCDNNVFRKRRSSSLRAIPVLVILLLFNVEFCVLALESFKRERVSLFLERATADSSVLSCYLLDDRATSVSIFRSISLFCSTSCIALSLRIFTA